MWCEVTVCIVSQQVDLRRNLMKFTGNIGNMVGNNPYNLGEDPGDSCLGGGMCSIKCCLVLYVSR